MPYEYQRNQLGQTVREAREARRLSGRALAKAAHVDGRWLARLELGEFVTPDPRYLHRVAKALGVETISLFQIADYGEGLPGFTPYLRTKYNLPPEAIDQLHAHFELLAEKYNFAKGNDNGGDYETTT
jgi:transcriptional regulator with XRE-family HTH domain